MKINKKDSFNSFNSCSKKFSCSSCERSARTKIREIGEIRVQNKKDSCANKKDSFNSRYYFPTVSGPSVNLVFKKIIVFT